MPAGRGDHEVGRGTVPPMDVEVTRQGAIATLWLNRPDKRNAVTIDMWRAMTEQCAALADDPGGAGPRRARHRRALLRRRRHRRARYRRQRGPPHRQPRRRRRADDVSQADDRVHHRVMCRWWRRDRDRVRPADRRHDGTFRDHARPAGPALSDVRARCPRCVSSGPRRRSTCCTRRSSSTPTGHCASGSSTRCTSRQRPSSASTRSTRAARRAITAHPVWEQGDGRFDRRARTSSRDDDRPAVARPDRGRAPIGRRGSRRSSSVASHGSHGPAPSPTRRGEPSEMNDLT